MKSLILLLAMFGQVGAAEVVEPTQVAKGTISDVDIADGDMKVTLSVAKGKLTIPNIEDLAFIEGDGTDDPLIVFTGKIDAVNRAVSIIQYFVNENVSGTDILKMVANDQGHTGSGGAKSASKSLTIDIPAMNFVPVLTMPANVTVAEDVVKSIMGTKVKDEDIGNEPMKMIISVNNGTLSLRQTSALDFTEGDGVDDKTMTFTGDLNAVGGAISVLHYKPDENWNGKDVVTITADDQGATGYDGPKTATDAFEIVVTPVNDTPEIILK